MSRLTYLLSDSGSCFDFSGLFFYGFFRLNAKFASAICTLQEMKRLIDPLLAILFLLPNAEGQLFDSDIYTVNPYVDGAITLGAFMTNYWGLRVVDRKAPPFTSGVIVENEDDINAFDRSATQQDADFMKQAWKISDVGMGGSFFLPVLLMFDKEIRQDWAPTLLLFLETEAIVGNLFSWGAAIHIDRIRPLVYHPDVSYEDKTYKRNKKSLTIRSR